jgi:hypothetical protein
MADCLLNQSKLSIGDQLGSALEQPHHPYGMNHDPSSLGIKGNRLSL